MLDRQKLEEKILADARKKNGGEPLDERIQQENSLAISAAFSLGVVFDLVMILYYFFTRNIEKSYPYVAQLLVMSLALGLVSLGKNSSKPPKTMYGKAVNADKGLKPFMKRVLACSVEMLIFAAMLIGFDIYIDKKISGSIIGDALVTAVTLILTDVIVCEYRVRRYRSYLAKLDAEENDLD